MKIILSLLFVVLAGCVGGGQSSQNGQPFEATPIDVPDIDPSSIGNMRVAVVSKNKQYAVILINRGNQKYLHSTDKSVSQSKASLGALEYRAEFLPFDGKTELSILKDEYMAKMEGLLEVINFYQTATSCSAKQALEKGWPQDTIVVEKDGQFYCLARAKSQIDSQRRETKENKVYRIVKSNIMIIKRFGYRPMHIQVYKK